MISIYIVMPSQIPYYTLRQRINWLEISKWSILNYLYTVVYIIPCQKICGLEIKIEEIQ